MECNKNSPVLNAEYTGNTNFSRHLGTVTLNSISVDFVSNKSQHFPIDLNRVTKIDINPKRGFVRFRGTQGQKSASLVIPENGVGSFMKYRMIGLVIFAVFAIFMAVLTGFLMIGGLILFIPLLISDIIWQKKLEQARQISSNWQVMENYLTNNPLTAQKLKIRNSIF